MPFCKGQPTRLLQRAITSHQQLELSENVNKYVARHDLVHMIYLDVQLWIELPTKGPWLNYSDHGTNFLIFLLLEAEDGKLLRMVKSQADNGLV